MNHPSDKITHENLRDVVYWHAPDVVQVEHLGEIAKASEAFMKVILDHAPDCADRERALNFARSARMYANSSVVLGAAPLA